MKKSILILVVILSAFLAYKNYNDRPRYILADNDIVRQLRINDVNVEQGEILQEVTSLLQSHQYGSKSKNLRLNQDDVVIYNISFMYGEELRHIVLGDVDVFYESSEIYFEVIQGDKLQESLDLLLSEKENWIFIFVGVLEFTFTTL